MRYLFMTLLLTAGLFEEVHSGPGNCAKYDVKIELIDGKEIRGFVYIQDFGERPQFQGGSFLDYLKESYPFDTLRVYKDAIQLRLSAKNEWNGEETESQFDATTVDNATRILKKDIKTIKVVSYNACIHWGIDPTVVTELTRAEIELLQTKPLVTIRFRHDIEDNTSQYWMMSYSPEYTQADLEKFKNDFLPQADKLLSENKWAIVQDKYKILKTELRKKRIILFKVAYPL
jgi:hypothetical protein